MAEGIITRKDIITDEAINWGPEYEAQVKKAIDANKEFVSTIIDISKANEAARKANNQTEYLKQAQDLKLKKQEAIALIKQEEELEKSLEKIKQEKINTQKKEIELENKKQSAKDKSNKLTIEERVLNEANNRALRQQARETLGLVGEYDKLNARRRQAQTNLANLLAEGKRADQTQKEYNRTLKAAQKEFEDLNNKVKRVDAATDKFTNNIGNYKSAFQGLRSIASDLIAGFGILTGTQLFVGAVKSIFETTKELQSLDGALKQVTGTQENYKAQTEFLKRISESYGVEIKGLTKTFTQFYVSAKDKLAASEIQDIFESITKAGAKMGLSTESQERAFLALNQMMSKGTIQAEELRGQLGEALPGSLGIMAKALGVSELQLGKMMKDGKLLAADVLPKFAKQLEITYGIENVNRIENITASQNRLSNSWVSLVRNLNESDTGGISKIFKLLYDGASGFLDLLQRINNSWTQTFNSAKSEGTASGVSLFKERAKLLVGTGDEKEIAKSIENAARNTYEVYKTQLQELYDKAADLANKSGLKGDEFKFFVDRTTDPAEKQRLLRGLSEQKAIILEAQKVLSGSDKKPASVIPEESEAERNKRLAKLKKELDDYLKMRKKAIDDEFDLLSFRNEREIYYNQLIVDDEKKTADERVNAFLNIEQLKRSQADEVLRHELQTINIAKIENEKAQAEIAGNIEAFSRQRIDTLINTSNKEIDEIIRTGTIKKNATNEEILAFEQYKLAIEKITQGSEANRQKLIDSEADKIQKSLDLRLKEQDTALNNALTAETEMYNKGVQSLEETERKKNEIRLDSAKRAIQNQIDVLQAELDADAKKEENARLSAEKRIEIQNKLSKLGIELAELDYKTKEDYEKRYLQLQEETANRIKDLQQSLKDALIDFVNALFDAKIQAIDAERQASNDYYDNEIEKAGDDQRKKEDLQKIKEKKDKEFEDKRKKEVLKAAIFNRVVALAQVAIDLAKTIVAINLAASLMDTYAAYLFGGAGATYRGLQIGLAVGSAALQTGAILATPLPKYRTGRRSGKAEAAIVGDGYVSEVITDSKGQNPRLTSAKPEITFLGENDMVFPNVSAYEQYMRNASMRNLSNASSRVNDFRFTQSSTYDKDILEELRRNTDAVKKGKMNITVKNEQPDYAHLAWAFKNNNWRN